MPYFLSLYVRGSFINITIGVITYFVNPLELYGEVRGTESFTKLSVLNRKNKSKAWQKLTKKKTVFCEKPKGIKYAFLAIFVFFCGIGT